VESATVARIATRNIALVGVIITLVVIFINLVLFFVSHTTGTG